jgi:site-specific DNA recombinase
MVRADQLEQAVWEEVCRLLEDPRRVQAEYERRASEKGPEGGEDLPARVRKLEQSIARLIDSYAEGLLEKAEFESRLRDRKQRLARLEEEATRVQDVQTAQQQMRLVVGRIGAFALQVSAGLETMDWAQRRDLVRSVVKHVEIGHEEVTVAFRVNPPPVEGPPGDGVVQHCPVRRRVTGPGQRRGQWVLADGVTYDTANS